MRRLFPKREEANVVQKESRQRKKPRTRERPAGRPLICVGRGIAAARTKRRITRQQLADLLKVPYHRLGHWERGDCQPTIWMLLRLGRILRIPFEEFRKMCEVQSQNPSPEP